MFFDIYKSLCDSRGISPKKAAMEIGLSNSVTVKWKAGATPSGNTLAKIADYFGVTTDYLLGAETEKAPTTEGERTISEEELMAAFFNGGAEGLTKEEMAEMWEDAREYIQYKLAQKRRKRND